MFYAQSTITVISGMNKVIRSVLTFSVRFIEAAVWLTHIHTGTNTPYTYLCTHNFSSKSGARFLSLIIPRALNALSCVCVEVSRHFFLLILSEFTIRSRHLVVFWTEYVSWLLFGTKARSCIFVSWCVGVYKYAGMPLSLSLVCVCVCARARE